MSCAAAISIAATVVLSGCGSSSPALPKDAGANGAVIASTSSAITAPKLLDTAHFDACTLLPQPDADTLVAAKLLAPIKVATGDVASCTYAGDTSGPTAQVEVYVGDGAKQQLAIDRDELHHTFTRPAGLGDEAWLEDDWIFARKGETWVSIRIVRLEDASLFVTPLKTSMAEALSKLTV